MSRLAVRLEGEVSEAKGLGFGCFAGLRESRGGGMGTNERSWILVRTVLMIGENASE